uniref:Major facilitator superfamily (MFS) profile domain-containing protein n=2 Tax=Quercus lobata TaxID=97700 RepID=A0A7N2LTU0_QUELO
MFSIFGVLLGYDSGNMCLIYLDFAAYFKNKEKFLKELILSFSVGSIVGGAIFCTARLRKLIVLLLLLIADVSAIIGCLGMSYSASSTQIYIGRGIFGVGISLMSISMPIIIIQIWPTKCKIVATTGLAYQIGLVASQLLVAGDGWRSLVNSYIWLLLPHLLLLVFVLCFMHKGVGQSQSESRVDGVFQNCKGLVASVIVQLSASVLGVKDFTKLTSILANADLSDYVTASSLLGSIVSVFLVVKLKRKVLLVTSLLLMTVELALMGFLVPNSGPTLTKVMVCSYIFTLCSVMSGLPSVYTFEAFPKEYRGVGFAIVCLLTEILQVVIFIGLDMLTIDMGFQGSIYAYAVLSLVGLVLTHFFVFETKTT